jgi:hypothetical protein
MTDEWEQYQGPKPAANYMRKYGIIATTPRPDRADEIQSATVAMGCEISVRESDAIQGRATCFVGSFKFEYESALSTVLFGASPL